MKLQSGHLKKLRDNATRQTLKAADEETQLRVILTLDVEEDEAAIESPAPEHETREEMRRRLIESKKRARGAVIGPLIDALIERRLDVKGQKGPRLSRSIVVDGTASDILKGIELPGVSRAQLDKKIELDRPEPSETQPQGTKND